MNLPASVKVGGLRYRIESWHPSASQAVRRFGECAHLEQVIRVDESHGPERTREVLLHEILHAITHVFGPDHLPTTGIDDQQEAFVGCAAMGLTAVLLDNPMLRDWIVKSFEETPTSIPIRPDQLWGNQR